MNFFPRPFENIRFALTTVTGNSITRTECGVTPDPFNPITRRLSLRVRSGKNTRFRWPSENIVFLEGSPIKLNRRNRADRIGGMKRKISTAGHRWGIDSGVVYGNNRGTIAAGR